MVKWRACDVVRFIFDSRAETKGAKLHLGLVEFGIIAL